MSAPSSSRHDLEQLKKQAKDLLKGHRASAPEVVRRIRRNFPRLAQASDAEIIAARFTLQNAQRVIAHECGYTSAGLAEVSS